MKRLSVILCLGLLSLVSSAQHRPLPPEKMSDEEIIQIQTRKMIHWLNLDEKTGDRFTNVYVSFRKEIDAVAKQSLPPKDIKDETEIDKAIRKNFETSEQILQIRKKYYFKFKEFLKPSQIQMMYRFENEAGRRMHGGPEGAGRPGHFDGPGDDDHHHMPPRGGDDRPPMPM